MKHFELLLCVILLASCAASPSGAPPAPVEETLYRRLGEKQGIIAVVDQFVANAASDQRIKRFFVKAAQDQSRLAKFKEHLVNQICEASGGPCKYAGRDMKAAHKGMKITDAHFDALVEDLVAALDKYKVGESEKGELLAILSPMRPLIVERPGKSNGAKIAPLKTQAKAPAETKI